MGVVVFTGPLAGRSGFPRFPGLLGAMEGLFGIPGVDRGCILGLMGCTGPRGGIKGASTTFALGTVHRFGGK